jgi:hypothetical protein
VFSISLRGRPTAGTSLQPLSGTLVERDDYWPGEIGQMLEVMVRAS